MLTPAQIIPFLTHDDRLVRPHALDYLRDCSDPAPLTADHYWAMLDHVGGPGDGGFNDEALHVVAQLDGAQHTDASIQRLIDTINGRPTVGYDHHYQAAARAVGFDLLVRHRDLLLGCENLDEETVAVLRRRLELADASVDSVWDRLMELARKSEGSYSNQVDWAEARPLIEAAARHIDATAAPAMAALSDVGTADTWAEIFAVMVLGHARHAPAAAALVEKLDIDADMLREEAVRALTRIGTADVVERLATFIPGRRWDVRLYADDPLEHIKRPESEAAILRLLPLEEDDELQGNLHYDLCLLGSLAGLDAARAYVLADPKHPETIGLYEALIATATMNGVSLPEEPRWRALVDQHEADVAARSAKLEAGGLGAFVDLMRERATEMGLDLPDPFAADDDDGFDDGPPRALPGEYDPYARIEPIRNVAPKVGRNDPCPCGSGKKHKKCCGAPK